MVHETAPLTLAQERLWFLDRFDPGDPAYNINQVSRVHGPLDLDALTRALTAIAARHEPLRSTFPEVDGLPVQRVAPPGPVALELIDLTGDPARETTAYALAAERTNTRFDLGTGPLLRVTVLRLGPAEHVLCLVVHHIVADGWSMGVLLRELATLYDGGTPDPLPVRFTDHARAERDRDDEPSFGYWRARLADPPVLDLPTDLPRPPVRSSRGAFEHRTLPAGTLDAVARLARERRCTPFVVLLAAYQVLLARHTGQTDLCVGTPVLGRDDEDLEPLIGYFTSAVVVRADLSGDPTFGEVLTATRTAFLGAMGHPALPFERLVAEPGVDRDPSRTPLFQTMFGFHRTDADVDARLFGGRAGPGFPGIDADPGDQHVKFDLSLDVFVSPERLDVGFAYSTDLFLPGTVAALADRWELLLAGVLADPDARMSELPLLVPSEVDQLATWGEGEDLPDHRRVPELVALAVRRHPDRPAVRCGAISLSYAQLSARADTLARDLRGVGVIPGDLVAVCLPRSLDLVPALLAVWRCGAGYVPLDPGHPAGRRAEIVAETGVAALLTEDGARPVGGRRGHAGAAYVLHTSGSSGRPKGVVVGHAALAARVAWMVPGYGLTPDDRVVQFASVAFDTHAEEIWPTLAAGGTVVLLPDGARTLTDALPRLSDVTVLDLPTAYWHELVAHADTVAWPAALRLVILGGEQVDGTAVARWRRLFPGIRLVNTYGPTEATIIATATDLDPASDGSWPAIGRPLAGSRVLVLDAAGQVVPPGVPGELYLGGAGLADGYLHDPGRTAARFVTVGGGRFYRTGDRVRWRSDGQLEFRGRLDDQVKVRGHRVEPGEVAARLREHPAVSRAAVVVRDGALVAYVVAAPGPGGAGVVDAGPVAGGPEPVAALTGAELREYAAERLPAHLVPSVVVVLDALPLTPAGKVDVRALPAPGPRPAGRAPATPTEVLVAGIWAELLGAADVAAGDDFFGLGGHSLHAVRVAARLRAALGREVPIRVLFAHPTLEGLAAVVDGLAGGAEPLRVRPADAAPVLSYGQERLWFLDQFDPGDPAYTMCAARRWRGPLDPDVLDRALTAIVARHESLRTRFVAGPDGPLAIVDPPAPFHAERLDLTGPPVAGEGRSGGSTGAGPGGSPDVGPDRADGPYGAEPAGHRARQVGPVGEAAGPGGESDVERRARVLVAERTSGVFDLATGPLLRVSVLRLGAEDFVLCLVVHHIVADGVSVNVFLDELLGHLGGREPRRALAVQYPDHAHWQRSGPDGAALAYWSAQLADPPVLDLATDRPRTALPGSAGGTVGLHLPAGLAADLEAVARAEGCTLFMLLLAAWQALLARHAGQEDICVGSPVAGRDRVELEPMIGYFLNTLVLRGDLSGDPTFRELLARTRATVLDAFTHQDIPFERLATGLRPDRDLSRTPLFQTMFVLHNQNGAPAEPPAGVALDGFDTGYRSVKTDLDLEAWREPDALNLSLGYRLDLFDAATAETLAGRYARLLRAVGSDPAARMSTLVDPTPVELAWLTAVGTGPDPAPAQAGRAAEAGRESGGADERAAAVPDHGGHPVASVLDLFERRAAAQPDAPAVFDGDRVLTYGELDRRAARLAAALRADGVRPGGIVGVCLHRSADQIVALVAVWKAGGGYLPLDPDYPADRLDHMLADSGAALVVTREATRFPRTLPPDATDPGDRDSGGAPGPLAYVIYTSGSTGRPKGVVVSHAALAVRIPWMVEDYGLTPADRVPQFASISFDTHVEEVWPALAAGAALLVLPEGGTGLPELLASPAGRAVTVLDLPTPYWHELVADLDAVAWPPGLRLVVLGADAVHGEAVAAWRDRFPHVRLVNTYGPTEVTVIATAAELTGPRADGAPAGVRPTIGRPLARTTVSVRDNDGRLAAPGVPGELWVGGPGLADGYLGAPELTAARFVTLGGERFYRTGDRARWTRDGQLDFLGRLDGQVKVRGYRIEPGEIESRLLGHPGVGGAVAVVRDGALVGYVVGDAPHADLRAHLAATLPAHMVPTAFVTLDRLPLTANGKLDRRALPAPAPPAPGRAPATAAEDLVAGIWAEVLGLAHVGADDDFFALGGHSLLAVRVVARLRAAELDVSVRTLFAHPTVAGLAAEVEALIVAQLEALSDEEAELLLQGGPHD
ncbi:amino acid adenylation domain-containing protein [Longispora sp. NPDC051575]|uniref:amino acid adenylation domain-containing protein n=1 Tax=Longispora sp. NPDC051575 TaxID=3154943 RepID=UPI003423BC5B